jgi:multidrug resistance efflux pump
MSYIPVASELAPQALLRGVGPLGCPKADASDPPASKGLSRLSRRLGYTLGILVMVAMSGFLANQHLVVPLLPNPEGKAMAAGPASASPEDEGKLAVCFGYADLEDGVVALNPSQPGRVDQIYVKENEAVLAGAPLLRLEDRTARLRVEEAKAVLEEATARLAKAEEGPELHRLKIAEQRAAVNTARYRLFASQHTLASRQAKLEEERIGRIKDEPSSVQMVTSVGQRVKELQEGVTAEETKLAALELQDPAVELERVKAEVATMRTRLLQAEHVLEEHTLRAPEAGKVLRIHVTANEYLTTPPRRPAVQFCPERPRIIRAEVDQAFAVGVQVGQPALVVDDTASGNTWRGRVARIADWYTERRQIADEQLQLKDVRTLECLITLEAGQRPLHIGQRVRVTISRAPP